MLKNCLLATALLSTAAVLDAAEVESDCSGCHASAPAPEAHPPVAEVTVAACRMCHAQGDGYFVAVHDKHGGVGLACASCHGNAAADELQAQLDDILKR